MKPVTVTVANPADNSDPVILDFYGRPEVSLQVVVSGTINYTVQQTLDDPNAITPTPVWFDHPDTDLVAQTGNRQGNFAYIPRAIRVSRNSGTGSARLTVIQAGLRN